MDPASFLHTVSVAAIPVVFAITVHEVAHGWVARHFGDRTAESQGRLSLNPIRHVDPVGTVLVPASCCCCPVTSCLAGRSPSRSMRATCAIRDANMVWVSAAGPAANIAMALIWAFLMMLSQQRGSGYRRAVDRQMATYRHPHQRDARRVQHAADSAARRRPGPDQSAAARVPASAAHGAHCALWPVRRLDLLATGMLSAADQAVRLRRCWLARGTFLAFTSARVEACRQARPEPPRRFGHAPDRPAAPRQLPRRAGELGRAAVQVRVLLLRGRLACADDGLRGHRRSQGQHERGA